MSTNVIARPAVTAPPGANQTLIINHYYPAAASPAERLLWLTVTVCFLAAVNHAFRR